MCVCVCVVYVCVVCVSLCVWYGIPGSQYSGHAALNSAKPVHICVGVGGCRTLSNQTERYNLWFNELHHNWLHV